MDQPNVLVIDSDMLVCWALRRELSSLGLAVEAAGNGADAVARLRTKKYGLLFLDIRLPDRDGLQLLTEIHRLCPDARIVILSGEADAESKQRAFRSGASQFIEKPFELSEIVSVVKSAYQDFPDRRADDRYRCRVSLRVAVLAPAPEEAALDLRHLSATTVDVSNGGLRCRTEYPLRSGQRLEVRPLSRDDPCCERMPEDAVAQVVWVRPNGNGFTAGLRYVNPGRTS